MSRTHDPREPHEARAPVAVTETGASSVHRESQSGGLAPDVLSQPDSRNRTPELSRPAEPREVHAVRGRTFRLRDSEVAAMVELGKFRAIAQEHLIEFFYTGDKARFRTDIENLVRQGLVEMKSIPHEESGSRTLLALTKLGHRFMGNVQAAPKDQLLYHGFAKPRDAHHDADLYLLYQKAAEKIERNGGKSLRVVLDYEMKKRVYQDLAKLGKEQTPSSGKREVAERHSLLMVAAKIPVPDVRIEYETCDGEKARVDLELATGHYRGRDLEEKVRAGFSIYAHAEEASKLRRVLDQRELTAEILSL